MPRAPVPVPTGRGSSLDGTRESLVLGDLRAPLGLIAAVPAVMAYNYFARRIKVLSAEMDAFSNDFLNIVKRHFLR